jgi:serine/threonine protein kinase
MQLTMAPIYCAATLNPVGEEVNTVSNVKRVEKKDGRSTLKKANAMVLQVMEMSRLTNDETEAVTPRFFSDEIKTGRVLGRGGFCIVKQLHEIRLRVSDDDRLSVRCGSTSRWMNNSGHASEFEGDASSKGFSSTSGGNMARWNKKFQSRATITRSVVSNSVEHGKQPRRTSGNSSLCSASVMGGSTISCRIDAFSTAFDLNSREYMARRSRIKKGERYVIKTVDPKLKEINITHYLKGIVDLSMEAHFLSSLDHPNIINLRGMSLALPYENVAQMLVLDNLPEIFHYRLNTWMQAYRTTRGVTGFVTRGRRRAKDLLTDRLIVAYDIARAMEYIHSMNIIYRDLVSYEIVITLVEWLQHLTQFSAFRNRIILDSTRTEH